MTTIPSDTSNNLTNSPQTFEIPVNPRPISVAFSKDEKRAFVCHDNDEGDVSVIDVESSTVVEVIKIGRKVRAIAVSPDDKRIVVCNQGEVWVIDAGTLVATKVEEDVGADVSVEFSPDGGLLYFARLSAPQFVVLNGKSLIPEHSIWNADSPKAIAVSPNKPKVYFAVENKAAVDVFDVDAREIVKSIKVGVGPFDVALTRDGRYLCVCNYEDSSVSFIDTETEAVIKAVPVGNWPVAVTPSSDGRYMFVALNSVNKVTVIDVETFEEVRRFFVGSSPFDIAATAKSVIYTANLGSNSVSVVSLASGQ